MISIGIMEKQMETTKRGILCYIGIIGREDFASKTPNPKAPEGRDLAALIFSVRMAGP